MIERLRHLSIRVKLRLMLCTVLAVALLMACFAFVGLEFGEQHEVELARNATLAEVMTANLASALVFQHADAAVRPSRLYAFARTFTEPPSTASTATGWRISPAIPMRLRLAKPRRAAMPPWVNTASP